MDPGVHGGGQFYGMALILLIAVPILALRNRRPRRLRLEAMWIRPLIFLVLIGLTFASIPLSLNALAAAVLLLALVLGVGLGWLRGSLMRIEVHPETHDISAQASVVGMVFILALLVLRTSLRTAAPTIAGLPATAVADALILFAGAMMITQSVEMFLRARKLLAEAKIVKAGPAPSPGANPPIVR
jgi:hypothetical protein